MRFAGWVRFCSRGRVRPPEKAAPTESHRWRLSSSLIGSHTKYLEEALRFSLPAIGIVFDWDVHGCADPIELFMKLTDPKRLAICLIASGDVRRPETEIVNSHFDYCVAVFGPVVSVAYVREFFLTLDISGLAPRSRRLIEQPVLDRLGLTEDGYGRFVTEDWYRIVHDRCKTSGWGYTPRIVNCELSAELRAKLDELWLPC